MRGLKVLQVPRYGESPGMRGWQARGIPTYEESPVTFSKVLRNSWILFESTPALELKLEKKRWTFGFDYQYTF